MNRSMPVDRPELITSAEIDLLLGSIRESTDALRGQLDALDSLKVQILFIAAVGLMAWPLIMISNAPSHIIRELSADKGAFALFSMILGLLAGATTLGLLISRLRRSLKTVYRSTYSLDLLVRRASQLRDRHNFAFSQKVYVDVALVDAESLLKQAKRELNNPVLMGMSYIRRSHLQLPSGDTSA